ncbi:Outer membrane receptor proteins, mostly Fe transport [Flaviramulus basaltis]|uniref:Outer membrane receptor proteins, mostly Fe transport n=1 Tax=Flaviramulus basaltis TaxID=369401 RepID=A0A1K2IDR6_9FLAO|nr:TonB-dependent receptor [Flaviramulus basaltis]SFZ90406.1 Outer membrane receptor proteins, mostly Fe transport [Flaviramulus basaltis]
MVKKHLIIVFLCLNIYAFAQNGNISGYVMFDNNKPALGALIVLENTTIKKEISAGVSGAFSFKNIPFGEYTLNIYSLSAKGKTEKIYLNSKNKAINLVLELTHYQDLEQVTVNTKTAKKKIKEKGFAVSIIETKNIALQSVETNQLLDRTAGVRVRQSGGLGSHAHYNLNGMSGNSVKIFIDGIPIRNFGPSFSLNSIPPSLINRIEIYKGVVPAHLSDDAMGGAINIVLNKTTSNQLRASTSAGSFGTYKSDINGTYRNDKNGFTVRGSGFINYADNDYSVWGDQVAVQLSPGTPDVYIKAKRFHDRYRSQGIKAEIGYTNTDWADKLLFGALLSNMDKQIQTAATMEIVYGNRFSKQNTKMYNIDFAKSNIIKNLDASVFVSFSELNRKTIDTIATQYSWLGHPTSYYNDPDVWADGAEAGRPTLQRDIDQTLNSRGNLKYAFNPKNNLQFNHLLNTFTRDSKDPKLPAIENALKEERKYMKNIFSLSFENLAFNKKLRTTVFAKSYHMDRTSKIRTRTGNSSNSEIEIEENNIKSDDLGYGTALSYAITPKFSVFGSAEKAVRLPEAGEVFGNVAANVNASVNLSPERSKNYNIGISYNNFEIKNHTFGVTSNFFIRDTEDLIIQLPIGNDEEFFQNSNVGKIYTEGFDFELNYSYDKTLFVSANTSFFNARDYNVTYDVDGNPITPSYQRLPNTPYFTMNYNVRFDKENLIQKKSKISCYSNLLYVHEFFRHGNILGGAGKTIIPTQIALDTGFAYTFPKNTITLSFDVRNVLNRQLFDNYALQKPGRGFYGKLTYKIL